MNNTNFYKNTDISAGMYIHIPFCVQKCPYCDFYSITDMSLIPQFLNALLLEMERDRHTHLMFDTIYIGGGTPSILDGQDIDLILKTVHRLFKINPHPEITVEVNPGTVDLDKLNQYKLAGVNRLNIGVQSFNNKDLQFLGRIHSDHQADLVIHLAREAGFENIGFDLIYGLPYQIRDSWLKQLQAAIDFKPEHLSCYMLTYEKDTVMWKKMINKSFRPLPDKQGGELFKTTIEFLSNNGYTQYEISNFAKSSSNILRENMSRHNQKYWRSAPYLGFGPSAHSFIRPKRFWNVGSVKRYIDLLNNDTPAVEKEEMLTTEQMMTESIYLGLRKTKGIDIDTYERNFNISFTHQFQEVLNGLKIEMLIQVDEHRCKLTRKGMLFLDSIVLMFADKIP